MNKISQLSNTVFSSENNIKESIYCNSISILTQFLNNYYIKKYNKYITKIIEQILNQNIQNDNIFSNL